MKAELLDYIKWENVIDGRPVESGEGLVFEITALKFFKKHALYGGKKMRSYGVLDTKTGRIKREETVDRFIVSKNRMSFEELITCNNQTCREFALLFKNSEEYDIFMRGISTIQHSNIEDLKKAIVRDRVLNPKVRFEKA
jgi:hypothetical protein